MKCLKATGKKEYIRVPDEVARELMQFGTWQYVSKSEYKAWLKEQDK